MPDRQTYRPHAGIPARYKRERDRYADALRRVRADLAAVEAGQEELDVRRMLDGIDRVLGAEPPDDETRET